MLKGSSMVFIILIPFPGQGGGGSQANFKVKRFDVLVLTCPSIFFFLANSGEGGPSNSS